MNKTFYLSLIMAVLLYACSNSEGYTEESGDASESISNNEEISEEVSAENTSEDNNYPESYDDSAVMIELSENPDSGEGVTVDQQDVTITEGGTYVLSGELPDGRVIVNVDKEETVHLVLNGVDITNADGPAIFIEQADEVVTTLEDGTTNTLTDGTEYQLDNDETEPDAAFFSQEDLVINGSGKLIVNGNYNNGIRSKDDLILISGEYTVDALNNALKGKDSVQIMDGTYMLTTEEGDGIQANNSEDEKKGNVAIDNGEITINSGRDGIQAENEVMLQEAKITIQTDSETIDEEESYKGIKAGQSIIIKSGHYSINSVDDGLHSDGNIMIEDGELSLLADDDGVHADSELTINGGVLNVEEAYEGLEASIITVNGGDIQVTASDDGLNASEGSNEEESETTVEDPMAEGGQVNDDIKLIINDGTLFVDAEGDGLDSNGHIEMNGGTVTVAGPTTGGNGALDYDGEFTLSGGTLFSSGTSDMAMNVSESSTQASVGIYFDSMQEAGTIINLADSDGDIVAKYEASKSFQHLVLSSPDLEVGETYTLLSGVEADEDGNLINGVELGSFTLSDDITNISENGSEVTQENMMGGPPM